METSVSPASKPITLETSLPRRIEASQPLEMATDFDQQKPAVPEGLAGGTKLAPPVLEAD